MDGGPWNRYRAHPLRYSPDDETALVYLVSADAVSLEGTRTPDGWIMRVWPSNSTNPFGDRPLAPEEFLLAGSAPARYGGHQALAAVLEPLPRSTQRFRWSQPEAWPERDGQTPTLLIRSAAEPDGLSLTHRLPAASGAFELPIDLWPGAIEAQPKTVVVGADRLAREYSEGPVTVTPEGLELGPLLGPRPPARFEGTTFSLGEADARALVSTVLLYGGDGFLRDALILVNGSTPAALDPLLSKPMAEVVRVHSTDWMLETIDAPAGSSFSVVRDAR